jgi:hypothetical protein
MAIWVYHKLPGQSLAHALEGEGAACGAKLPTSDAWYLASNRHRRCPVCVGLVRKQRPSPATVYEPRYTFEDFDAT